ncbi:hypothetical protein [Streptomyces sp. NPDC016172]|uniref:InlB B-repeat-containing protein n=1 Tax=Streptomyces sp. NPDC016172 TaxID=3364964 RepID=UPI003700A4CA
MAGALAGVPLVPGHRYDIAVERDATASTATTAVWRGHVQDTDAAAGSPKQQIGALSVDASRGDLVRSTGGFVEHYRGSGVMDCPDLPYTKVTSHPPVAENATASATTTNLYGTCAGVRSNAHTARTGVNGKDNTVEVGFHRFTATPSPSAEAGTVTRKTPAPYTTGQDIELTATPAPYWKFAGWTVNGHEVPGTADTLTAKYDGTTTVVARFDRAPEPRG